MPSRSSAYTSSTSVGSDDPGADFGPLVGSDGVDRVNSYIQVGVDEGAEVVIDGRGVTVDGATDGFFVGATLFDNVTADMRIYREGIFGPVLAIVRANDYEDALRLPNEHEFGNGVAIFTRDGDTARDFATRVQVGMVGVNVPIPVPIAYHTFGGWKRSGFGDLNQHGPDSIRFYTKTKTVTQRHRPHRPAGSDRGRNSLGRTVIAPDRGTDPRPAQHRHPLPPAKAANRRP